MIIEIKVPSPGESVREVELARWLVSDGEHVEKDQELAEIESEKATLPLIAPESGQVRLLAQEHQTLEAGSVACTIDTSVKGKAAERGEKKKTGIEPPGNPPEKKEKEKSAAAVPSGMQKEPPADPTEHRQVKISPLARKMMQESDLSTDDVIRGLRRIGSREVEQVLSNRPDSSTSRIIAREVERKKMSPLRRKLSERLVAVKNETAMLTTFNEVDMSEVIRLRNTYREEFLEKHGVKPGFMSFFARVAAEALKIFPAVNSMIDGDEIVIHHYSDIGIAVQTEKGLMVPVIRDAGTMSLAELEKAIQELAAKARNNRITLDEMSGGTFTITNGGVFGSMLSTPLINPPQAAILGMHNIVERPVAIQQRVEIRPVMYLALSYDHRLIDGKESVSFLVKIKEFIENPHQLLFGEKGADRALLDL
ncbi:MAG: 2-oxoglutarate dehydrogenase complex dihydrolipoyllysine-residue succinyltransferase [Bacteroidales bacterium]